MFVFNIIPVFLLLICFWQQTLAETTVRMEKEQVVNRYFNCPDKLSYQNQPLLSDLHSIFLNGVGVLGREDHYEANHLFAQIFCIYLENSKLNTIRNNLSWDAENKTITFQEGMSFPLINFMSREMGNVHDLGGINLHTINASEDFTIGYSHSEFILLKYLEEGISPLANALPKAGCKILSLGLVIYSSLDSCDRCQDQLLQTFNPSSRFLKKLEILAPETKNIPWFIAYFSSQACKKSSYISLSEDRITPFYFDKITKKFFSSHTNQQMLFPCSIEGFDLSKHTEPLFFMSSIEK